MKFGELIYQQPENIKKTPSKNLKFRKEIGQ